MGTPRLAFAAAALALALTGCAGTPHYVEEPHHFSRDDHGRRIACYETGVAREYDCVPVVRRHAYAGYPFHDPWWPHVGFFYYGWHATHPWYPPHHPHWRHRGSRRH